MVYQKKICILLALLAQLLILLLILIKKNHPHVYLEECKYRIKKTQMLRSKFINTELKSDSDSDLDDNELMAKLKRSDSDSE